MQSHNPLHVFGRVVQWLEREWRDNGSDCRLVVKLAGGPGANHCPLAKLPYRVIVKIQGGTMG